MVPTAFDVVTRVNDFNDSGVCVFAVWCYPLLSTALTIIPTITHDKPQIT